MVLSDKAYRKLRGLSESMPADKLSAHLLNMIVKSLGTYTENLEVEVLGTVETQDLSLQVSIKALEEMNQMVFRRGSSIRPVRSLKHIVDIPTSTVLAVASTAIVAQSVASPTLVNTNQVNEGCTINAIYLRVEAISTTSFTQVPRIYMAVFKSPGNDLTNPNPNGTGSSDVKRFVLHQEMVMLSGVPATSEFPRTLFNGVVKIPRSLRRFGYNDRLLVILQNGAGETTGIANACIQAIYKEFI